jgi:hypothetical protein
VVWRCWMHLCPSQILWNYKLLWNEVGNNVISRLKLGDNQIWPRFLKQGFNAGIKRVNNAPIWINLMSGIYWRYLFQEISEQQLLCNPVKNLTISNQRLNAENFKCISWLNGSFLGVMIGVFWQSEFRPIKGDQCCLSTRQLLFLSARGERADLFLKSLALGPGPSRARVWSPALGPGLSRARVWSPALGPGPSRAENAQNGHFRGPWPWPLSRKFF